MEIRVLPLLRFGSHIPTRPYNQGVGSSVVWFIPIFKGEKDKVDQDASPCHDIVSLASGSQLL